MAGLLGPQLPHLGFRNSLHGQQVIIPDLYSLFPEWKVKKHEEYKRARDEVLNPWLQYWVDDVNVCRKLQMAEFALFAAIMCAETSFEKLCTVAKYFAWYFIWDDIFDCGSLTHDANGRKIYRQKSMDYFEYTLRGTGDRPDLTGLRKELQKALLCWDEVGTHIRETCSKETREILLDRMLSYVASVDTVDAICSGEKIPSLTQYWQRRELTAAVYPVIATIPFICGLDVSREDVDTKFMNHLWKHTSFLVHITNDMFSMRKEVRDNQIENLIPVLMMNEGLGCNDAMQLSFRLAQEEARGFREVENILHQVADYTSSRVPDVFIAGCKNVVMGLIHWSYSGQRYFKREEIGDRNLIKFQL